MDQGNWQDLTSFGIGLFAIMTPFACIPIILSLRREFSPKEIRQAVMIGLVSAFLIQIVAVICGEWLILALGTSLPSFQIAGGFVIALTGLAMMADNPGKPATEEPHEKRTPAQVGIVPLAMPMLAGPGSLTKVMLETHDSFGIPSDLVVVMVIFVVFLAAGAILLMSDLIAKVLGTMGMQIMTRLSGLIVIAIGVEIMVSGVYGHLDRFGVSDI